MHRLTLVAIISLATLSGPALATSSDWVETEGGAVRLVTTGMPGADGKFTGILDIMLKPGWKTYWRDPGDAGVPPSLDVSRSANIDSAELSFPAPTRHDEGDFTWAGYAAPVAFPVAFTAKDPAQPVTLDADVFLGICQTICIPVKAEFHLDPAHDATNPDDADAVKAAQAALPSPASAAFGATVTGRSGTTLTIAAKVPGDPATADIFLASDGTFTFGTPKRSVEDGKVEFTVEIDGPDTMPTGSAIFYTLISGAAAADGRFDGFAK
jgi:DsbC/DsbD-like thiol-disulfide interchange protein